MLEWRVSVTIDRENLPRNALHWPVSRVQVNNQMVRKTESFKKMDVMRLSNVLPVPGEKTGNLEKCSSLNYLGIYRQNEITLDALPQPSLHIREIKLQTLFSFFPVNRLNFVPIFKKKIRNFFFLFFRMPKEEASSVESTSPSAHSADNSTNWLLLFHGVDRHSLAGTSSSSHSAYHADHHRDVVKGNQHTKHSHHHHHSHTTAARSANASAKTLPEIKIEDVTRDTSHQGSDLFARSHSTFQIIKHSASYGDIASIGQVHNTPPRTLSSQLLQGKDADSKKEHHKSEGSLKRDEHGGSLKQDKHGIIHDLFHLNYGHHVK
jgi:hypothetical protein